MVQWLCIRNPADTTSEPLTGNGQTGAPVKAPMSDGESRNQGGTVEYFCIPPLIFRGWGIFYTLPNTKGGKHYGKQEKTSCKNWNYWSCRPW